MISRRHKIFVSYICNKRVFILYKNWVRRRTTGIMQQESHDACDTHTSSLFLSDIRKRFSKGKHYSFCFNVFKMNDSFCFNVFQMNDSSCFNFLQMNAFICFNVFTGKSFIWNILKRVNLLLGITLQQRKTQLPENKMKHNK
jgi:hypothetical protein